MRTFRLGSGDRDTARALFALMAEVFEAPAAPLPDAYVDALLARPDFWAIVAADGDEIVGGLTAHTLAMTRSASSEVFIYDVAVRATHQRQGVGRALMTHLREAAAAEGVANVFVPADEEDEHALDFYRALGGDEAAVRIFTYDTR